MSVLSKQGANYLSKNDNKTTAVLFVIVEMYSLNNA